MNNDYLEQSEFLLTIGKSITEKSSKRTLVESDQRQNLQFILNAVTEQHEHENDKLTNVQLNILQHQNISDDDNQNEFIEDEMTVRSSSPTPFTPATDISQTQQLDNAIRLSQKRSFHNINSQTQESIRLSQKKSFPNGNSQSQQFDNAIRLSQTQSIHNNSTVKTTDKQNVEVQNTGTEFTKDHNSNTNDENSSHYNCQEQKNDSGDKKQLPQSTTNTDCNQLHVQSQEIPSEMMTLITKTPSANLPGSIVTSPPVQIDDQLKSKQLDHGIPELNSNTTAIGQEPFEYIEMKECKPKPISDINTMGRTNVIDSTITDNSLLQIQKIPEPNVVVEKILTEEILLQLINQRFTISQYQFTTELKQHIPIDITKCKISSQTFNHSLQLLLQRTPKMARHPQHGQTYTFTLELLQIGEQLGGIPISIETFKKSKSYHSFIKRLYRFLVGSGDTKSPMKYIRQYRDKHK
ncbi:hypothetical protein BC833DRAFT_300151 [Globomyces pollinis-pini]|nr:hypothetical protein BC833DRAFT_300151 [Globomyces pollinis-pini]